MENIQVQDVTETLTHNYLPYAIYSIYERALPEIDGLKPSHRKLLYTMYKMGLLNGNRVKSSDIVGQTMGLNPHGDQAIYETMIRMTTGHEALLMPYIESKGNMGKQYSKDIRPAAPRYTEGKLAPITRELLDGIEEDAVEMVDNYNGTKKEPILLPVKFPSVLVNVAPGMAVGMASNVAPYNLSKVCKATIGILKGEIETDEELFKVLGYPDFSTGGNIVKDDKEALNLIKKGSASFTVYAKVELTKNSILIKEVPYGVNTETIVDSITKKMKLGELKEISDVRDDTDIKGLCVTIELKRGIDPLSTLEKIYRITPLRTKTSFSNRVIVNKTPEIMGAHKILSSWIDFRVETLKRIYSFRTSKKRHEEEKLSAWELLINHIEEYNETLTKKGEDSAIEFLAKIGLNEMQSEYILDQKSREFARERANRRLLDLEATRKTIAEYEEIVNDENKILKIIISELESIQIRYGTEQKTSVEEIEITNNEEVVDDRQVMVYTTGNGYIKKIDTLNPKDFPVSTGDSLSTVMACRNDSELCVFTRNGSMHRLRVLDLDFSKGVPKDFIQGKVGADSEVIYVCPMDYKLNVVIVGEDGQGYKVNVGRFQGTNRKVLKGAFKDIYGKCWIIDEDKFFVITESRRAIYQSVNWVGSSGRSKIRVPRMTKEKIFGVQPLSKVPNVENISLDKYSKGYFVNIGDDKLWKTAKERTEVDNVRFYKFDI